MTNTTGNRGPLPPADGHTTAGAALHPDCVRATVTSATVARASTGEQRLREVFAAQQLAFAAQPVPSLDERLQRLAMLRRLVIDHRQQFRDALASDFGSLHPWLADLLEAAPVLARLRHVEENLPHWLVARDVPLLSAHGSATASMILLPKGVNGVIAPWNFPIECSLVMLADILGAGNTAIVKPSELAPATAQALDDAISDRFDPQVLAVVQGGPDLAATFSSLPWGHLTFTGSAAVGREVAQAAARNLVPLTLALGGKNPAVFAHDGVTAELVERFLAFRTLKAGQVCTAPDHVMVPATRLEVWIEMAVASWRRAYPHHVGHPDATGIINDVHYRRLLGYLDEARDRGVRVVPLNDDLPDPVRRQVPMTLVVDPPADLGCMRDEVLGPVVPVLPYATIDDAMARINSGPAPVVSYLASYDRDVVDRFVRTVRSGTAGVNSFGTHAAVPALVFGGIGASGYGCHLGREGFLQYSQTKAVFFGSDDSIIHHAVMPPIADLCGLVADAAFGNDGLH